MLGTNADSQTYAGVMDVDAGKTMEIRGAMTGGGGLKKAGDGTLKIATGVAGAYTGATSVVAGVLELDGTLTSAITVDAGAKLQGSGSTTGGLIISGTVAPGNSIESLGAGDGGVTFNATSTFAYELNSTSFGGDLLYTSGGLSIADGAKLTLTDLADAALTSGKLTLISYTGTWVNTQLFKYGETSLADDSQIIIGSNTWVFNYNDTIGGTNYASDQSGATSFMTLTVIPEPGTAGIVASFLAAALLRKRRFG